jgi:hypothetical protein
MTQKTIVRYDRKQRTWQAINGKAATFGPGKHNKRRALRYALRNDHPALFEAVINIWAENSRPESEDQLMDRLLKAAALIAKGKVFSDGYVESQSDDNVYQVTLFADGGADCTCQDFENGLARRAGLCKHGGVDTLGGHLHCKHTLAVKLAQRVGLALPEREIPF